MLTLSAVLHVLDWELDYGVYISYDPKCDTTWLSPDARWVSKKELRDRYDWKKERVICVKRTAPYDTYSCSNYIIVLRRPATSDEDDWML